MEELVGIEVDAGARGLIAVDDEGVVGRALLDDDVGRLFGTQHGLEAGEGHVRRDEEHRHGDGDRNR